MKCVDLGHYPLFTRDSYFRITFQGVIVTRLHRAAARDAAFERSGIEMRVSKTLLVAASVFAGMLGAASASDADFKLVNKTGYQIDNVYVGAHSSDSWGKDIMGKGSLGDEEAVNITFPHGGSACMFDIKVKYNDGDEAQWGNINLCEYEKISLYWKNKQTTAIGE